MLGSQRRIVLLSTLPVQNANRTWIRRIVVMVEFSSLALVCSTGSEASRMEQIGNDRMAV